MAGQRHSVRAPGRRQPTNWARGFSTDGAYVTVAPSTKVLLGSFSPSVAGINETVRRTRGLISIVSDQTSVIETQAGAFGMVMVTDLAIAAGAASIPGPITDASDDGWFVWQAFFQSGLQTSFNNYEFDSKAMRRMQDGYSAAIMVENANTGLGLDFGFGISLLSSIS